MINWFEETFLQPTMVQAVTMISIVSAVGLYLGRIKFFGVSLGITFVFFAGILAGHLGVVVNKDMLLFAQSFGLIIFVYTLGLQVGPSFFSSLKEGGVILNSLSMAVVFIGLVMALVLHYITDISLSDMMGLLSGAVTNTPALGAAQQALLQIDPTNTKGVTDMALACAVTYPLGVVGVILAIILLKALFAKRTQETSKAIKDTQTYVAEFSVCNPAIYNKQIKDVMKLTDRHFVISRVWRKGKVSIPTSDTTLEQNDHLLIISVKSDVENIKVLFGEQENVDWNKEDIDWNAIDSQLVSKHVVISRPEINGKKLGSLRLRNSYGINISRVTRSGVQLLATPGLVLQLGDRLTVVGEAAAIQNVEKVLGNTVKTLKDPNMASIFIGIVLGLIIGAIPISIPGISSPVKLGLAGGPIIIGILIGAYGPRLHLVTYTTRSANLMLRGIGLSLYLACLGLDSGEHFFETVIRPEGLLWIAVGFGLTLIPVLIMGVVAFKWKKVDFGSTIGMLCGSMANPMALNYANDTLPGDNPSVAYATVYPLCMFVRVIIAQVLLMFLLG